jgi:hypothetical protein
VAEFDAGEPADVAEEVDRYTDLASPPDVTRYLVEELVVAREEGPGAGWLFAEELV